MAQPAIVIALIIARIGCHFPEYNQLGNLRWLYNRWKPFIVICFLITIALFWAIDEPLGKLGKIETKGAIFVGGITIAANLVFNYFIGFFQAVESFRKIGILYFIVGIATLLLCVIVVIGDLGTLSIYGTEAAGRIIAIGLAIVLILRLLPRQGIASPDHQFPVSEYSLWIFFTMLAFFIAYNMDILLVKAIFDRTAAGDYLRMDLAGKLMFLLGSTIAIIIFPKASKAFDANENSNRVFVKGTIVFFGIAGSAALLLFCFNRSIFGLVYGDGYSAQSYVLACILITRISEAYIFIQVNYLAAVMNAYLFYSIAGLVFFQSVLLYVNHETLLQVASSMTYASVISAIAILIIIISFESKTISEFERAKGSENVN